MKVISILKKMDENQDNDEKQVCVKTVHEDEEDNEYEISEDGGGDGNSGDGSKDVNTDTDDDYGIDVELQSCRVMVSSSKAVH